MKTANENIILTKTFNFSIRIYHLSRYLQDNFKEFELAKQILRSGTSIGANTEEAVGGYSKKDFTAKMGIAYKEARETNYWLRLLQAVNLIEPKLYESLHNDCDEIAKILYSIIQSSK